LRRAAVQKNASSGSGVSVVADLARGSSESTSAQNMHTTLQPAKNRTTAMVASPSAAGNGNFYLTINLHGVFRGVPWWRFL
jgi:hypothetical protein